ncbi:MAG TPA: hypothetical protein VHS06_10315 [Chloroflexota bacterium]|nr:hypothetical protein [Chloroflexota bacterium]
MAKRKAQPPTKNFRGIPLWGWILIFLLPLVMSEFMFSRAGRTSSAILFPIVWIAFWFVMMMRFGWPMFKKDKER